MEGFIIYSTNRILNGKSCVLLYGKLKNNQSFLTINEFKPYFFIKTKDLNKAKKIIEAEYEETDLKNFQEEPMTKIILEDPKEVSKTRNELEHEKIKTYESDVRYTTRFLVDNKIQGPLEIEGDYESHDEIDRVYTNPELKQTNYTPKNLKILSFDIETDKESKKLYCISFYSKDYKKTIIVSNKKFPNTISCEDEEQAIEAFQEEIIKFDPDIITGWNVIDFDLAFLREKFKKYKIPFILGRDNEPSKLRLESDFFRTSKADLSGRVVLDGLDLTRSSFIKLDNYKLDTAAQVLLGKTKLIQAVGKEKYEEINRMYKHDQKELIKYNLLDAELVYRILTETTIMNLTIQRSLLTGMPLDKVNASIASLDFLYLQKAREKKLVAPTNLNPKRDERIKGGYVMDSMPGIYNNLIVLDFKSLYPAMIRTFNIDPYSFLGKKKKKDAVEAPNKVYFDSKKEGILPEILGELWKERDIAKKQKNKLAIQAIKIMMLSFWGVLANPLCRFYNLDMANGLTGFGRSLIKQTAEKVKEKGYTVIYSDTDSIFVDTKTNSKEKAHKIGKKLEKEINEFYDKHIKEKYHRKSFLELEYEKLYLMFLMPKLRGVEKGAKKRYAGLLENGKIQFVGLETVRSDWTQAAKIFQKKVYDKIFHKENPTKFIKKFVEDLRAGKYDKELLYRKSLRKDVKDYKVNPPHLKAAKKLKKITSSVIEYYWTTDGPEPIQALKHKLDYDHYIDKQIRPIADTVLELYDLTFKEVLEGKKQTKLFDFK
ncbi:DNA polymerase II [archaeon]|nr:DNA polymerase II [archaeon]